MRVLCRVKGSGPVKSEVHAYGHEQGYQPCERALGPVAVADECVECVADDLPESTESGATAALLTDQYPACFPVMP